MYEAEVRQREALRSAIGTPVTLISIIATILAAMLARFNYVPEWVTLVFWGLVILAVAPLLMAMVNLFRAYHGHKYQLVASAGSIRRTEMKLEEWYAAQVGPTHHTLEAISRDLDGQLTERYVEATDHNAAANKRRSEYLYRTNAWIVYAVVPTALAAIPFLWNQAMREREVVTQVVDIPAYLYMEHLRDDRRQAAAAARAAATAAQTNDSSERADSRGRR
jgi:hypothetical protein